MSDKPNSADQPPDGYDVGYGKPPEHTRFKKGKSGNPTGRPKGARNLRTELKEELNTKVTIREDGKARKITKGRALIKSAVNRAVMGDARQTELVTKLASNYGLDAVEEGPPPPPTFEEKEQLRAIFQRLFHEVGVTREEVPGDLIKDEDGSP